MRVRLGLFSQTDSLVRGCGGEECHLLCLLQHSPEGDIHGEKRNAGSQHSAARLDGGYGHRLGAELPRFKSQVVILLPV